MDNFIDNIYFDSKEVEILGEPDILNNQININNENENDNNSVIDTSWIQEYDKLNKISNHQERTYMDIINTYFVYINKNQYIEKILFEKIPLDKHHENRFSHISKEFLLKIIQSKKIKTPFSKYKLIDILSFIVNIEPELIQDFSNQNLENDILDYSIENNQTNNHGFFKVLPIINDISIDKSIFIFHNINSLYFIFQEVENQGQNLHRHTLRSILKKNNKTRGINDGISNRDDALDNISEISNKNNSTKKVRIVTDIREQSRILNNHKDTHKNRGNKYTRKQRC